MSNVRFYRLSTLPGFVDTKHQGIFVHVTTGDTTHKAGLWFGGVTGWEYLTNDTTPESITNAINALDVNGYAQATIGANTTEGSESATDSKLTILGIKEVDGKISNDDTKDVNIAIEGIYDENTNKIATQLTVKNAIESLDSVGTIQAVTTAQAADNNVNTVLTFKGIKEENGKILQGDGASTFTVGDAKLKIQIGSAAASDVFSANAQSDSTIQLDGNVFKKNGDVISVITKNNDVSSTNPLVTKKDIDSLAGAMHYKGTVSSLQDFQNKLGGSDAEEAGDVYIATGIPDGSFIDEKGNTIENGDMIVFDGANEYSVIQSNLTLGTGIGQIAANTEGLTENKIVVATSNGIKTIDISIDNLTDTVTNNKRNLTTGDTDVDANVAGLYHSATITDTFKVIGKDFSKKIKISSTNRSIEIKSGVNSDDGNETGVMVDLIWNTVLE